MDDSLDENTQIAQIVDISAQAKTFGILMKKSFIEHPQSVYFEKAIKYDKIFKFDLKLLSSYSLFLWSSIEYRRALEYKVSFLPFQTCLKLVN